jgi:hypothetical protein
MWPGLPLERIPAGHSGSEEAPIMSEQLRKDFFELLLSPKCLLRFSQSCIQMKRPWISTVEARCMSTYVKIEVQVRRRSHDQTHTAWDTRINNKWCKGLMSQANIRQNYAPLFSKYFCKTISEIKTNDCRKQHSCSNSPSHYESALCLPIAGIVVFRVLF